MGSGFFSQDNPPPAEQSPAGPGPGNVVLQEPTGVDGATASFFGRGAAPALQAFEEDAKAAAGEAAASAAAAAASAVASAASAGEALNVATGIDAFVDQAEAAKNAAQASATNSANSATAAAGSASAANTSATQASTSATNAGNSATAAATSATNSATSAASAVSSASQAASSANSVNAAATTATAKAAEATASATNAANSATSASTSASTAITKAAEATTSASAAAGSATTAGTSATAAGTSATNAANSASAAGTSATNAAASAATATTKASESSTSATNAASSATSAAGSATTATTKASEASASAANAAASATTATTKASEASTSATNAASSATAAGTSATNAANSASAAGTSVTNAANSATAAANSATAAAGSATAAAGSAANASSAQSAAESARDATLAAFDSFDDRYLGTKISNPTADNDGNALVAGALYFNSTAGEMRVWTGSVWTAAYVSGAGVLLQANNLSDLANASTARTNLGLGNVENKSSATIRSEITSGNVTTALGYTPYNSSNPNGYISGITSGNVTTALGYTPANRAGDTFTGPVYVNNGSHQVVLASDGNVEIARSGGSAYIDLKDSTGEDFDVRLQANGNQLAVTAPGGMTLNGAAVLTGITSGQVTTALGYTPYNSSNPSGYITSAALSAYLPLTGGSLNVGGVSSTHSFLYNESGGEIQLVDSTGAGPILLDNSGGLARFYKVGTGAMSIGTTGANYIQYVTNSAERMRITSGGDVGIGTSAPASLLHVKRGSNAIEVYPAGTWATRAINATDGSGENGLLVGNRWAGTGSTVFEVGSIYGGGTGSWYSYYRIDGTGQSIWSNGGTERMRLDTSGRLGIGTSAPGKTLDLVGQFRVSGSAASGYALLEYGTSATATNNWHVGSEGDGTFRWYNGTFGAGTERMRITSAGNVGVGTSSPGAKLDVSSSSFNIVASRSTGGYAAFQRIAPSGQQAYDFYTINGVEAGRITVDGSNIMAFSTGSAAAERMRIDASGQVGIGLTNPGYPLAVQANSGSGAIRLVGRPADSISTLEFANSAQSSTQGYIQSNGNNLLFATSTSERARIDSSGNVGIGTSSPGTKLDVVGDIRGTNAIFLGAGQNLDNKIEIGAGRTGSNYAYIDLIGDTTYTDFGLRLLRGNAGPNATSELLHRGTGDFVVGTVDAGVLRFSTNNTERMRFDSAGTASFLGLLTGRSSAATDVNTANDTGSFSVRGSSTTIASMSFHRTGAYAINMGLGTDNVFRIGGWSASSNAFQMDGSGNLTMLGNVTAYSDARIKKDVETIDSALDLVSKMRGVRYTRIDTKKRGVGVIAQEMLEVCPEVVQQGVGDDDTLSVAYGNLVGVLIEAIKELKAEVETLKGKNP